MSVPVEKLESGTDQSSKSQEGVLLDPVCVSNSISWRNVFGKDSWENTGLRAVVRRRGCPPASLFVFGRMFVL